MGEELAAMYISEMLSGVTATVGGRRWDITDSPGHPLMVAIERPTGDELAMLLKLHADYCGDHASMNSIQISGGDRRRLTMLVYADETHRQFVGHALRTYLDEVRD